MTTATLLVLQGVDQGKRAALDASVVSLGRSPQNGLRILDTEVSRKHAELRREGTRWTLADLSSSNGTFVNGQPIRTVTLRNGDQIQIGRTILLFSDASASAAPEPVADRIKLLGPDAPEPSQIVQTVTSAEGKALARQAALVGMTPSVSADANLKTLYRISEEAVRATDSLDTLLQRVLDLTISAVSADRGCMLVSESRSDKIVPRIFSHRPGVNPRERMPVSTSIVTYVIRQGEGVWTADARHDVRFDPGQSIVQAGIREAMCVPMQGRYELMGVIYVDITSASDYLLQGGTPRGFSEELLSLLLAIGRQSALAVENYRYQEALVTAERLAAIGQTIASLGHDIKNILQGIRGGSYLIDMGLKDGREELIRQGWGIVERNQDRIYSLVMDMLAFSKERRPQWEQGDLNALVADVCALIEGRKADHPLQLVQELSPVLPTSMFDPEGMHRAILNVVGNAVDAVESGESGRVTVRTGFDAESESLFVDVIDNGPGIPPEERELIFDLFQSSKGSRGTGLGLPVSRKILQEHGGDITVECPPEGGCRFRLAWPLMTEEPQRATDANLAIPKDL